MCRKDAKNEPDIGVKVAFSYGVDGKNMCFFRRAYFIIKHKLEYCNGVFQFAVAKKVC